MAPCGLLGSSGSKITIDGVVQRQCASSQRRRERNEMKERPVILFIGATIAIWLVVIADNLHRIAVAIEALHVKP